MNTKDLTWEELVLIEDALRFLMRDDILDSMIKHNKLDRLLVRPILAKFTNDITKERIGKEESDDE